MTMVFTSEEGMAIPSSDVVQNTADVSLRQIGIVVRLFV
jgi:hypothetical protein